MLIHGMGQTEAFGTTPEGVAKTPILSAVASIANALIQAYGQVKAVDLNSELVKQGKPPLSTAQMQALSPQLGVDIDIGERANLVMYGLLGVAIFAVIAMRSKR